jgi:hypothetical protein
MVVVVDLECQVQILMAPLVDLVGDQHLTELAEADLVPEDPALQIKDLQAVHRLVTLVAIMVVAQAAVAQAQQDKIRHIQILVHSLLVVAEVE